MAALQENSKKKESLTRATAEVLAEYRPGSSDAPPWLLGRGRYLVITVTKSDRSTTGTVFETSDGTRFIVAAFHDRAEADAAKVHAGSESEVFAVRPSWSFPAREWIAADRGFWQPSSRPKRD